MALEDGVGLEGLLLRADEVAGAEERRQQLGGRDERLERRSYRGRRSRDVLAGLLLGDDVDNVVDAEVDGDVVDVLGGRGQEVLGAEGLVYRALTQQNL